jgi:hypothetical protein
VQIGTAPYAELRRLSPSIPLAIGRGARRAGHGKRSQCTFVVDMMGDPRFSSENPVQIVNMRPGLPTRWLTRTVKHKMDGTRGFRTELELEIPLEDPFDVGLPDGTGTPTPTDPFLKHLQPTPGSTAPGEGSTATPGESTPSGTTAPGTTTTSGTPTTGGTPPPVQTAGVPGQATDNAGNLLFDDAGNPILTSPA